MNLGTIHSHFIPCPRTLLIFNSRAGDKDHFHPEIFIGSLKLVKSRIQQWRKEVIHLKLIQTRAFSSALPTSSLRVLLSTRSQMCNPFHAMTTAKATNTSCRQPLRLQSHVNGCCPFLFRNELWKCLRFWSRLIAAV